MTLIKGIGNDFDQTQTIPLCKFGSLKCCSFELSMHQIVSKELTVNITTN